MKNAPRPRARTPRAPKHHIPIGLQIAVRALDGIDADGAHLRKRLGAADIAAQRVLHDPLTSLDNDGAGTHLDALAKQFGAEQAANRIADVIPESATHDPHAWLADHAVCWQNAGLYLGLCLGFRIAAGLSGRDGEQGGTR